jgi:predicted phage terminase large subunit-like protein
MVEPVIENLRALGEEIAADRGERFGSEHLAMAMDRILPGTAYWDGNADHRDESGLVPEEDSLDLKLAKLERAARIYIKYDRYLAENGIAGNREIDAAVKRIRRLDGHKDSLKVSREDFAEYASLSNEEFTEIAMREARCRLISYMCKTNGLFLGREVLNRDFTFYTHGPSFDFFVQKSPYKTIAQQDIENKVRLLEMPRGAFKSVTSGIDTVQWIIINPDVRIMFLTASLTLAKDFVTEVRGYFEVEEKKPEDVLALAQWYSELTPFKYIFAQDTRLERPKKKNAEGVLELQRLSFLITTGDGKETQLICPARTRGDQKKKEVTIWAGSVGAGKVGKHCHIIKADDAVDEKNSENAKLIQKTKKRIGMALKLLDPGGYNDNIGTPYAPNDWYNHLSSNVQNVLMLIRPAKTLKRDINGATAIDRGRSILGHEAHDIKDLADADWNLLFPCDKYGVEKLTHEQLRANEQADPEGYPSQYMLNPSGYKKVSFTNHLITQQTLMPDAFPSQIEKFTCHIMWDLADTQTTTADYSVGVVMLVDRENRGFIVEIFRDKYTYHEICQLIAKTNHEYKPTSIIIEDARGASKLKGQMEQAARDLGDKMIPLNFVPVKNYKASKSIRIGKLEPRMKNRTLWFSATISCYQDLLREFVDFGSDPHDDIPDAIALCEHVLPDVRPQPSDPAAAEQARRIMEEKEFFERIHASPEPEIVDVPVDPMPETEQGGTGNDSAGDLYDPYAVVPYSK